MRYSISGTTAQQVKKAGGTNLHEMPQVGVIYADMTPQQAANLESCTKAIVIIARDVKLHVTPPTPVPASLEDSMTPQSILDVMEFSQWKNIIGVPTSGLGYDCAVIDTGVYSEHANLLGAVVYEEDFSKSGTPNDIYDHGTGVADVIHLMVPQSKLLNLKVMDNKGMGSEEAVVAALSRCLEMHEQRYQYAPNFICLSLGSKDDGNPNNPIRLACKRAIDDYNIWIAAAAGNDGPGDSTITCPATERYVCAVGSVSLPNTYIESYSSRGPTAEGLTKPDVTFIGKDVLVASSKGQDATKATSGTSFATPFIIGMTTMFRQAVNYSLITGQDFAVEQYPAIKADLQLSTDPTMQMMIDDFCAGVCLKPGDTPYVGHKSVKDNTYGYGTPFATLAQQFISSAARSQAVASFINPIMSIMMMGMMVSMTKPFIMSMK